MDPMECITFLLILFEIYWIIVMWRSLQKFWRWFRKPLCFWSDNKLWQCVYQWFIMGVISLDYVFLYCKFIWYRPGPSKGSQMVSKGCQFTMFLESTWHPLEDVGILRWVGGHLEFLGNTYNFGDWTNFGDLFLFWPLTESRFWSFWEHTSNLQCRRENWVIYGSYTRFFRRNSDWCLVSGWWCWPNVEPI